MTNKPKAIGTYTETAIVNYLLANGFDTGDEMTKAQRIILHGADDHGDIGVCPGVMIESKGGHAAENASDATITEWLAETERERVNRRAHIAALVTKRKGKGAANAGTWWTYLPGWAYCLLARLGRTGTEAGPWNVTALGELTRQANGDLPAVRITLAELATMLRRAGYGDPLEVAA